MRQIRVAGYATSLFLILLLVGCGDTFRPVVNPITTPGPDPQNQRLAIVLSQGNAGVSATCPDGTAPPCVGSATTINVSGDTNVGNFVVGKGPVHSMLLGGFLTNAYIANRDNDTVSIMIPLSFGSVPGTISLPTGSAPVFVHSTQTDVVYVANSGSNTVGVIDVALAAIRKFIPVGSHPVALQETPNGQKVYCVNQGDNTVSVIATVDGTVTGSPIVVGASPIRAAVNSTGTQVYVLNQGSGTVSVIDTATDGVTNTIGVGSQPTSIVFDSKLQRLYVTNSGSNTLSVIQTDTSPMTVRTVNVGTNPASVAALADGSRVYVANAGSNDVSVVDTASFAVRKTIVVGGNPLFIAASSDSSKVYVALHDQAVIGGNTLQPGTAVIRTDNDTKAVHIPAPFQDPINCTADGPNCPRQRPVFVIVAP